MPQPQTGKNYACVNTHNPQTIYRHFGMKTSDAVLPPASRLRVGEVWESRWSRPNLETTTVCECARLVWAKKNMQPQEGRKRKSNLAYQDVSCGVFNENVSFHSFIKGKISSRRAGAAHPWVLWMESKSKYKSQFKGVRPLLAEYC